MNISLTPTLEAFIRRKVASGLYNNASEVVREAVRLLIAQETATERTQTGEPPRMDEIRATLAALEQPLRERGVTSVAVFGSIVHGNARPDSDIDVLVDIDPKAHFSLVDLVSLKCFLEGHLGREVDVVTREGIEPALRDRILREAQTVV